MFDGVAGKQDRHGEMRDKNHSAALRKYVPFEWSFSLFGCGLVPSLFASEVPLLSLCLVSA